MQVSGLPNKYKILQLFYLDVLGKRISYNEALNLFYNLDAATKNSFMEYYADEVGYVLIAQTDNSGDPLYDKEGNIIYANSPFAGANGFGLDDHNVELKSLGKKTVKKKEKQSDGTYRRTKEKEITVYNSNLTPFNQVAIKNKYSIDAYAAKNGLELDPIWGQYSAEEIIQMENEGVNIPQKILDIAHSIVESQDQTDDDGNDEPDETTEREPFLKLIPKAEKYIDKCQDKNRKIDDKVDDLLEENKKANVSLTKKMDDQRASLKEYEALIREWRLLQDKVNNGEALTDTEARRYAQITGMLEDKNSSSDFKLDKNAIARHLNEINILAVLGEKLADETIDIADDLAYYTSKENFKTTQRDLHMGFFGSIAMMLRGRGLAKAANKVGNDTKDYTDETKKSVNDVASLLGVQNAIANPADALGAPEQAEADRVENAQNDAAEQTNNEETLPPDEDEKMDGEAAESENDSVDDDFIINDENVQELIDQAEIINSDLLKQFRTAAANISISKDAEDFAKIADKIITKLVEEYQKEEERRQQEIQKKEDENKEAQEKIDKLSGGKAKDQAEEYSQLVDESENDENQKDIDEQQEIIDKNNQDIEAINQEGEDAIEVFKTKTSGIKETIDKKLPEEDEAFANDSKYKDEIIPEDKEQLLFTNNSGITLKEMGTYRVTVGIEQILHWQWVKGLRNIKKGRISIGIGNTAQISANRPIVPMSEKLTNVAVDREDSAIEKLTEVNQKIISVTGEEEPENINEEEDSPEGLETEDNSQSKVTDSGETNAVEPDTEETPVDNEEAEVANDEGRAQQVAQDNPEEAAKEADEAKDDADVKGSGTKKKKEEMDTGSAQKQVEGINKSGKEDAKDSEHVKKDTEKDEKQLKKETQKLQKQMKKDEKLVIKMTKESMDAAKKQEEILSRYEELTNENDQIAAEEEQKQSSAPAAPATQPQDNQNGATNAFSMTDSSQSSSADNAAKMEANGQEINTLNTEFKLNENKINRNRTKIVAIQKRTKTNQKKVVKKSKVREKKIQEAEKKEQEKQKRLAKQLGIVGVAENLFSLTETTGLTMIAIGSSMTPVGSGLVAAGTTLKIIGLTGLGTCAVTKATINIANGNLTAALVGLGATAVTVATSVTGTGAAAGGVLGYVSNGLSVVATSAELVNNVRAIQGKEANGLMSKISTVAGVASSLTSSAATIGNLGKSGASAFGKAAQIAGVVGSTMSSASQIMTEFNLGGEKAASVLGMVGGALSMAASVAQLASAKKKDNLDNKNDDNKDKVSNTDNTNTDNNTDNKDNKTDNKDNKDNKTEEKKDNDKKEAAVKQQVNSETNSDGTPKTEQQKKVEQQAQKEQKELNKKQTEKQQKKAQLDQAKQDQQKQKEIAKNAETKEQKKNIIESGASKEYANVSDAELQSQIEGVMGGEGDLADLQALQAEQTKRADYQKGKAMLDQRSQKRKDTFGKITEAMGAASNVAALFMNGENTNAETDTKKKYAGPGTQDKTKRFKKIEKAHETDKERYDNKKKRLRQFAKSRI